VKSAEMLVCKLIVCDCQELTTNPQFFVGGASRFDVQQGELGNIVYPCTACFFI